MKPLEKILPQGETKKVEMVKGVIKKQLFTGLHESGEVDAAYLKETSVLLKRLIEDNDHRST